VGWGCGRGADGVIYADGGREMGVVSTKTFTATVTAAYLMALALGLHKGFLSMSDGQKRLAELAELPRLMTETLESRGPVAALAAALLSYGDFLFLVRGLHSPIALDG